MFYCVRSFFLCYKCNGTFPIKTAWRKTTYLFKKINKASYYLKAWKEWRQILIEWIKASKCQENSTWINILFILMEWTFILVKTWFLLKFSFIIQNTSSVSIRTILNKIRRSRYLCRVISGAFWRTFSAVCQSLKIYYCISIS